MLELLVVDVGHSITSALTEARGGKFGIMRLWRGHTGFSNLKALVQWQEGAMNHGVFGQVGGGLPSGLETMVGDRGCLNWRVWDIKSPAGGRGYQLCDLEQVT